VTVGGTFKVVQIGGWRKANWLGAEGGGLRWGVRCWGAVIGGVVVLELFRCFVNRCFVFGGCVVFVLLSVWGVGLCFFLLFFGFVGFCIVFC